MFFIRLYFLVFTIFSINLFANSYFYTVTVCTNTNYKDALYCKNSLLKEHKYDIFIIKDKNFYQTTYGKFTTAKEAYKVQNSLNENAKRFQPFASKIFNKQDFYELFETYQSKVTENIFQKTATKNEKTEQKVVKKGTEDLKLEDKEKIIYLTFDDGPIKSTNIILDVLEEQDIPATMFFIGYQAQKLKDIYERAKNLKNIQIANHTYSHANGKYRKFYKDPVGVLEDIKMAENILNQDISKDFLALRLAGRNVFRLENIFKDDLNIDKYQRKIEVISYDKLFEENFLIYGWDVEWEYEQSGRPKYDVFEVVNRIEYIYKKELMAKKNKVVLLMHDIMFGKQFNGKENLSILIEELKKLNWKFDVIDNY